MTKTIKSGFFKGEVPPPPFFGVVESGEPTLAHGFDPREPWKSLCGLSLRLMRSVEESELPTCEKCVDVSVERDRGFRQSKEAELPIRVSPEIQRNVGLRQAVEGEKELENDGGTER